MLEDLIEVRATIKGRVQGVGFRVMARQLATSLGIVGTVRNLVDGSVEIHAVGKRQAVQELLKVLKEPQGPGKVSALFSEEISPLHHYVGFTILS
ncbi:MAG TPA: acylphosphatase [Parachlamydiaceae bacterium]|nr:acylphosphatase [Parachlamydiaceae bacterium]